MNIVGVQKTTLLDFPGKIAMTVFTLGCNMRCPYCHNKQISFDFVDKTTMDQEKVFSMIKSRKTFIDGVVISGGEPTLQLNLLSFLRRIKKEGLLVKLDTNGTNPDVVQKAIEEKLVDYIALDIKTSFQRYEEYLGVDGYRVLHTYNLIKDSGITYELRMTCYPDFISKDIINEIVPYLSTKDRIFIQHCNSENSTDDLRQLTLFGEMLISGGVLSADIRYA